MGPIATGTATPVVYWDTMSAEFAWIDTNDEFTATEIDAAEFGPEII